MKDVETDDLLVLREAKYSRLLGALRSTCL